MIGSKSLLELAAGIVQAQTGVSKLSPEDIEALISKTYDTLKKVKGDEEGQVAEETAPPISPKKSIKQATVTCLECGKTFKVLTKRHLALHGITPKEYRVKWGFKPRQPLAAKSLSAKRKKSLRRRILVSCSNRRGLPKVKKPGPRPRNPPPKNQ